PIDFEKINAQNIKDATSEIIKKSEEALNKIYSINTTDRNFENTLLAYDNLINNASQIHSTIYLLSHVSPSETIRNESLESTAILSKFFNTISLSEDLYNAIKNYSKTENSKTINNASKKFLKETIEEFERNGFALSKDKREIVKEIQNKLSELGIKFDSNISSHKDSLIISEEEINGLPDDYKNQHKTENGKYKIDLSYPSYIPFMRYSKSDKARKELAKKFKNIAADKNLDILKQILIERERLAKTLDYKTFAEYQTENRMAKNPKNVWDFENNLKPKVKEKAKIDYQELLEIKQEYKNNKSINTVESWEAAFYSNILKKEKYKLDNNELKEYFELNNVIKGLFNIAQHLYNIEFEEIEKPSVWHEDVRFFEVRENKKVIARFYLDLFPRDNKFNHAACFGIISGKQTDTDYQKPTASLVCNFPKATKEMPALMTHEDVETFFHEFGHLMHAVLTKAELSAQAGTNVARDFVEMPSQIFENWAWNYEALSLFAKHYKTKEVLPKQLHNKMIAARNVGSGLAYLQQVFYGSLDMTYHDKFDAKGDKSTTDIVRELQNNITLYSFMEGTHFEAGFGHLNGYAAGYYGYLWAKVFSEDMFSIFEKNGVMNKETGKKLKNIVLEKGSTIDEMDIVKEFLGREVNENAFLKAIGL
ncbi:MAG: M3 family metallopeptidase, partial [Bacteroidota bacterium]|nr:M3 family metallopeptidase [Bacteroidota bacterium]